MSNLVNWIEEEAGDEAIKAVVIGEMGWGDYGSESIPNYGAMPKGVILSWEEAKKWLNYEFYSGFGAPKCQAVYAWTEEKVIAISQYDGSTNVYSIPRNPTACMPEMAGS